MKKFLIVLIVIFFSINSVSAYELTEIDWNTIDKIVALVNSKSINTKASLIKSLERLKVNYFLNNKIRTILKESIDIVKGTPDEIDYSPKTKTQLVDSQSETYAVTKEQYEDFQLNSNIWQLYVPAGLGDLFQIIDWDVQKDTADVGRKMAFGFTKLGSGGSKGFIEYSTYDFEAGTMYNTYATKKDYDDVISGKKANIIDIDGKKGYMYFKKSQFGGCDGGPMGGCSMEKVVVFPYETYYVAVVIEVFSTDEDVSSENIMKNLQKNIYPTSSNFDNIKLMQEVVENLKFAKG
ncbi:MAG: hypothetical protein PHF46_01795 [Candidatus Gracilibacteria bacterium]|nr:hypothetical protein [Candidatus Gracilibacteria bacterium]MDD3120118.1 hypothetical protein [Candidatus Gracilibacteria bacterium]MDD4530631.1 hypothetical protein [Candidatus Gracilibacteria bacterium]